MRFRLSRWFAAARTILGIAALAAALSSALAGPPAMAGPVALVIGNDGYRDLPALQKARADARGVGERLVDLGFEVVAAEDLDRAAMSRALVELDARIAPGDTVFFFYAGHGFAIDGENYLLPIDVPAAGPGEAELVRDASFAVSRIVERLRRRGASTAILVLDACRDNPFEQLNGRGLSGGRGLLRMEPPDGVFVLYSAGQGQVALDRLTEKDPATNSVFTRVFLTMLDRPGLSLVRIAKETQIGVRRLAASIGHDQTPAYYDQIVGDVVLRPGPGSAAAEADPMIEALLRIPKAPLSKADDLSRLTLLYEEARAAEARGDGLAARAAYLALAGSGLDVVDPYLRYAALLRVQEGRAGAREEFGRLAAAAKSRALSLVHILQFDDDERRRRLDAFLAEYPAYGPALYQAASEYSADRLGRPPSRSELMRRAAHLQAFLAEEAEGTLARHFLDQSVLAAWIDEARRDAPAVARDLARLARPGAVFTRSNGGWTMTLQIAEPATAVFWRDPANGELVDTGRLDAIDPRTGAPMPNPNIPLPADQPPGPIAVAYRDAGGVDVGPFEIAFDPLAELQGGMRRMLELQSTAWLTTRRLEGRLLMETTALAALVCGIREARFGLDDAEPSTPVPLPACDPAKPFAIPDDHTPYLEIPGDTRRIRLDLVWQDGSAARRQVYSVEPQ